MYPSAAEINYDDSLWPLPSAPPEPPSPVFRYDDPPPLHMKALNINNPKKNYNYNNVHPGGGGSAAAEAASKFCSQSHHRSSHNKVVRPWSTDLCNCCDNISSCCLTCWCPCVTFGRIAEIVDRGSTSCGISGAMYMMIMCITGCPCLYSCFYRSKLRGQYLLEERPCTDCCVHFCCHPCSLCQEYRHLNNQGFDMSIGWHGNMERRKKDPSVPPFGNSDMKR